MSKGIIITRELINEGYTGSVYRFFKKEIYADDFCKGKVRVSTLESYRNLENPEQGDKGEATWMQKISAMYVEKSTKEKRDALRWAGVDLHPDAKHNYFEAIENNVQLKNAYAICATRHFEPDVFEDSFGEYCVEISNAHKFCEIITDKISIHHKNISPIMGRYSDIKYLDRKGENLNIPSVHIGFIKPADPYAPQKEFRFLWTLIGQDIPLEILDLDCPEITKICKRIR